MTLRNKVMAALLPALVVTSSIAMAGEPYGINCSRERTLIFSASIATPFDTNSSDPRQMSAYLKGGESFADTIDAKTLKSLMNAEAVSFFVKNETVQIDINAAGVSINKEIIRTTGSVEMLDSGVAYDKLDCSIILRVKE